MDKLLKKFREELKNPNREKLIIDPNERFIDYAERFKEKGENFKKLGDSNQFPENFTGFIDSRPTREGVICGAIIEKSRLFHADFAYAKKGKLKYTQMKSSSRRCYQSFYDNNFEIRKDFNGFENISKENPFPRLSHFFREGNFDFENGLFGKVSYSQLMWKEGWRHYANLVITNRKDYNLRRDFEANNALELYKILEIENNFFKMGDLKTFLKVVGDLKLNLDTLYFNFKSKKNEDLEGLTFNQALEKVF